jgi:hypothetical protein
MADYLALSHSLYMCADTPRTSSGAPPPDRGCDGPVTDPPPWLGAGFQQFMDHFYPPSGAEAWPPEALRLPEHSTCMLPLSLVIEEGGHDQGAQTGDPVVSLVVKGQGEEKGVPTGGAVEEKAAEVEPTTEEAGQVGGQGTQSLT